MSFKILSRKKVLSTVPFDVEEMQVEIDGRTTEHPYHRIVCPNWVNILPITSDGKAIVIDQHRAGNDRIVTEIPGGVVEPDETDMTLTAARELEEETGYVSDRILSLGNLNPNPAIQNNRCHFFLALNCKLPEVRKHFPDEHENITIRLIDKEELVSLASSGGIDHSLAVTCIMLAQKYL